MHEEIGFDLQSQLNRELLTPAQVIYKGLNKAACEGKLPSYFRNVCRVKGSLALQNLYVEILPQINGKLASEIQGQIWEIAYAIVKVDLEGGDALNKSRYL